MRRRFLVAVLALALPAVPAPAQEIFPRPHLDWRTVETRHFVFHYPREMEGWTLAVAARMDSVREAVRAIVGWSPERRITVVVDDPLNAANGSAWPLLDAPAVYLWPIPPEPTSAIGHNRSWGEILSVHELAHIAHLTRPTRNARWRWLLSLLPARFSTVALRSPRWLIEGYATYVEGRLTGSGRPHGAFRPAVLRQWALEGKLPSYGQLDGDDGFLGGSMAYLVGSAYLEWLVAQRGDSSLAHLWRRMSARRDRGFAESFAGVFGGMPWDLYDRFVAELTAEALAAERAIRGADGGVVAGDTILRLEWGTGAPTLSRGDSLVAAVVGSRDRPSRVVVWRTAVDTAAERREREAVARMLERDPEDVAPVAWRPPPRRAVATLLPHAGRPHESPRFLPDGRLLVTRLEPLGDGRWRPDLFVWDWRARAVTRLTSGAGVRDADPSPDGRAAVAQRCAAGSCDVVRVDLATGAVTTLLRGGVDGSWSRPRWSPDGRRVAAARKTSGSDRWRVVVFPADDPSAARPVDPDDGASRYHAAWAGADALVVVSEASGAPNLERIDLSSGDGGMGRPLTRVTGAAFSPAPTSDGRSMYFLSLHARGLDLARAPIEVPPVALVRLGPELGAAGRDPGGSAGAPAFAAGAVSTPRPYGLGPRRVRVFPAGTHTAEGGLAQLLVGSTDPVGRLTWLLQGAYGRRSTWRGAALGAAWRGWRPTIAADVFHAEQRPSRQRDLRGAALPGAALPGALDADYSGASLSVGMRHDRGARVMRWRLGASAGSLDGRLPDEDGARALAFAEWAGAIGERSERATATVSLALHGAAGTTAGERWRRAAGTIAMRVGAGGSALGARATYGETSRDAPAYERMIAGGADSPLLDPSLLSQRVEHPAIPLGVAGGRRLLALRGSARALGIEPYLWAVSAGDSLARWYRVVGVEGALAVEGIPLVHLPDAVLRYGVGYPLDEPARHRVRPYIALRYRP
jgi:hypothetical protein